MGPRTCPPGTVRLKIGAADEVRAPLSWSTGIKVASKPFSVWVPAALAAPPPNSVAANCASLSSKAAERSRFSPPFWASASTPADVMVTSWK